MGHIECLKGYTSKILRKEFLYLERKYQPFRQTAILYLQSMSQCNRGRNKNSPALAVGGSVENAYYREKVGWFI